MSKERERKYFIVRHDLVSLQALPNYIWRTHMGPKECPHRFEQVQPGDRWVSFAYTSDTDDDASRRVSLITGFYECTEPCIYEKILELERQPAWTIKGKTLDPDLKDQPVAVRPINQILGRRIFANQAITPLGENGPHDFNEILQEVRKNKFDPTIIPVFGREPRSEQELLTILVAGHKDFGIDAIVRVQTRFPDVLVKLKGQRENVHLELEAYSSSFVAHGHHEQVKHRKHKQDGRPVAVLCWIDDDHKNAVKPHVHKIFELRSLIRDKQTIQW